MSSRLAASLWPHFFLLLCVAVLTRWAYLYDFQANPFYNGYGEYTDSLNYDLGAKALLAGDWLASGPVNAYSPLYKYLLGAAYWVFGDSFQTVWLCQSALGAATVLLIFLIGRKLFNPRAGLLAALLFNFYGPALMYEGTMLRATLIAFLGVWSLYQLILIGRDPSLKVMIPTALAVSLFIQSRPNVLMIFIVLLILGRSQIRAAWPTLKRTAPLVFLFFIPLLVQASLVHGKFVFFEASGPMAILAGNHPDYPGMGFFNGFTVEEARQVNFLQGLEILFERFLLHPLDFAAMYLRKIYFFFSSAEAPNNVDFYFYREFSSLLKGPLSNFAVMASLGLAGMAICLRNKNTPTMLFSYALGLTLGVVPFSILARYRIPAAPYFALFAGFALDGLLRKVEQKDWKPALVTLLLIANMILALSSLNPTRFIKDAFSWNNGYYFGVVLIQNKNFELAGKYLKQYLVTHPDESGAHRALAESLWRSGRLRDAVRANRHALLFAPPENEAGIRLDLALLFDGLNEGENARAEVRRGIQLTADQPDSPVALKLRRYREILAQKY